MSSDDPAVAEEIRRLEERSARNPRAHTFARLADLYRKDGRLERALEVVEAGLAHHPHYLNARIVHARVLRELGRTADAASAFREVLEIDAENLVARQALRELRGEGGLEATPRHRGRPPAMRDPGGPAAEETPSSEPAHGGCRSGRPASGSAAARWLARLEADWREQRGEPAEARREPAEPRAEPPEPRAEREEARERAEPPAEPAEARAEPDRPATAEGDAGGDGSGSGRSGGGELGGGEPGGASGGAPGEPRGVATATLAALYARQGLYDEAIGMYETLLARDPYNAGLARALQETRRMGREGGRPAAEERAGPRRAIPRQAPSHAPSSAPAVAPAPGGAAGRADEPTIRAFLGELLEGRAPTPGIPPDEPMARLRRWLRAASEGEG